jgi:hypothetical protein
MPPGMTLMASARIGKGIDSVYHVGAPTGQILLHLMKERVIMRIMVSRWDLLLNVNSEP